MIDFLLGVPGKLKTIIDYLAANLSTVRAAKIDNLDAAISTRAAAATALSSATWTATLASYLDGPISGRLGSIKSIQQGAITIVSGNLTGTATIAGVDPSKSICFFMGTQANSTGSAFARVALTNSTTVTATRGNSDAWNVLAGYTVVEFN